ncbi:MAG: porphobilinogen synthase [Verrucomicrobia bacterium]|nr:porphobilinogen synthase [Verrucomicrobiota bacterium]
MTGTFPFYRPRRLRQTNELRAMVRESHLRKEQLVLPLFVTEGTQKRVPVPSMPGVFQLSIDELLAETRSAWETGVRAILLFGIPDHKDEKGSSAYDPEGITQRAVRALRKEFPDLIIITDVCLCEYTSHGHCGMIRKTPWGRTFVDNDSTLEILAQTALSHVMAGADIVAPSDMMDGRIGAIRKTLDDAGFTDAVIMSYAAKYASAFYGPFRDAADSAPKFGDRRAYQMDPANAEEALREVAMDIEEGADIVMVKPGLAYLDILNRVKNTFHYPTAVYMVSGEYAMIKAAGEKGWIDEDRIMMESHLSMVRAGADIIITYAAPSICKMLNNKK